MDAIDQALLHEDRLTPSMGFSHGVMTRIHLDPLNRSTPSLPWGWVALAALAALACVPWVLFAGRLDREVVELVAWGTAVAAASVSLAGLSYQLLDV
jgi:uncharacterized membrane protein